MHLTAAQLVDLADGSRGESSVPHLASCETCRRQLADLRATTAAVSALDPASVPEPSPLFWDHFQQRVGDAVAAQAVSDSGAFGRLASLFGGRVLAPVALAAAIGVMVIVTTVRRPATLLPAPPLASIVPDAGGASSGSRVELLNDAFVDDDPSLRLVADLTTDLDWTEAGDAGLAGRGSAEHAVTHLSAPELRELQRLLKAELGT